MVNAFTAQASADSRAGQLSLQWMRGAYKEEGGGSGEGVMRENIGEGFVNVYFWLQSSWGVLSERGGEQGGVSHR